MREGKCVHQLNHIDPYGGTNALAAYDDKGLIFATYLGRGKIHLFDARNPKVGCFSSFEIKTFTKPNFLKFAADSGSYILCQTDNELVVLDSFNGEEVSTYEWDSMPVGPPSFSSNSEHIAQGLANGEVHLWRSADATRVNTLSCEGPTAAVFNNKYPLVCTGGNRTDWWIE